MWMFFWFLFGLLTGLAFALPTSPGSSQTALLPKEAEQNAVQGQGQDSENIAPAQKKDKLVAGTTPPESQSQKRKSSEVAVGDQGHASTSNATTNTSSSRGLRVVESDPLSAVNVNNNSNGNRETKLAKKLADGRRRLKSHRSSLRNRGSHAAVTDARVGIAKSVSISNNMHDDSNHSKVEATPAIPGTTPQELPDPIPMDAESRWRDHHLKRQWAQSLLIESMEPALSRHLRHAIKSVLHSTSVGPEIMDLKAASYGMGHLDSLMTPIVLPPRTAFPDGEGGTVRLTQLGSSGLRGAGLARSTTRSTTMNSIRTSTSVSQPLESSLSVVVESPRSELSRSASLRTDASHPVAENHSKGASSPTTTHIVVRGFSSPSTTAIAGSSNTEKAQEMEVLPNVRHRASFSSQPKPLDGQGDINVANAPQPPPKNMEIGLSRFGSSSINTLEAQTVETLNNEEQLHHQSLRSQSRTSRLWTRVRRVVQGDFKSNDHDSPSKNTVYLTSGSVAGSATAAAARPTSETQLLSSSRPISTSSTASSNPAMPSFSSSALSLLSEDQMSPQRGPTKIVTSHLKTSSSTVFETPPETVASSRHTSRPTSPTSRPTSPTSRPTSPTFGFFQNNLPGLARRSLIKSPVAAAELTAIESSVSQFMFSDQHPQQLHHTGVNGSLQSNDHDHNDQRAAESHPDFNVTPNALERSTLKNALHLSRSNAVGASTAAAMPTAIGNNSSNGSNISGRSRSISDAQYRHHQWKSDRQRQQSVQDHNSKELQDYNQFQTVRQQNFQELRTISPSTHAQQQSDKNPVKSRPSLDRQTQQTPPASPMPSRIIPKRLSISPFQPTDSGPVSPSQLLSGSSNNTPLMSSKEERRKSAISFGGYFSNTSEAARRSRNQIMDHSVMGLESNARGEVIHLRRTSFFDRPSSPPTTTSTLASLTSLLQMGLPLGPNSPPISRSPSNTTVKTLAQEQQQQQYRLQHSRHASAVSVAAAESGDMSRRLAIASSSPSNNAIKGAEAAAGSTAGGARVAGNAREAKKKVTPLKITPPLFTGVSSVPSPAPLSTSIPRSFLPSSFPGVPMLDRHFFNVDQVHEWNIPSYGRVKFTDHAPLVFHAIRERFNYTLADMDEALSQPMTVMKTPGKSDAVFFASHNHGRFLLKTLRNAEPENLKGFLSDYLAHIQKYPNTLLPRYLGMYTFERLSGSKISGNSTGNRQSSAMDGILGGDDKEHQYGFGLSRAFSSKTDATAAQHLHLNGTLLSGKDDGLPSKLVVVVLANVFDTPEVVHERYDFKGSNVGRRTLPVNRATREKSTVGQEMLLRPQEHYFSNFLGQRSTEPEPIAGDFIRRRASSRRAADDDRASIATTATMPKYDPREEHSHSQTGGRTSSTEDGNVIPQAVVDNIGHLTLKEMDFQNRVFTGETRRIHLGESRRSEVLSQLEEDTALLRKHDFMDYSMLVGIRIVPKAPQPVEHYASPSSSSQSSRRESISSRGSDADNSNLDSDEERSSINEGSPPTTPDAAKIVFDLPKSDLAETMDRFWKMMNLSQILSEDQRVFWKELGEKAQETWKDIYSFGEGIVVSGNNGNSSSSSKVEALKSNQGQMPEVELRPVQSNPQTKTTRRKEKRGVSVRGDGDEEENYNLDSFQTVRYKPRSSPVVNTSAAEMDADRPRESRCEPLSEVGVYGKQRQHLYQQNTKSSSTPLTEFSYQSSLPLPEQSHSTPLSLHSHHHQKEQQQQQPIIWSQGVPSEVLPDGYEAIYYFGLIDILQKYNLTKWLERNIKGVGVNVRLLGASPTTPAPPPLTTVGGPSSVTNHPGRSTASSSFSAPSLYQLLPQATASEPSLPSVAFESHNNISNNGSSSNLPLNPTLSVLLEDSGSGNSSSERLSIPSSLTSSSVGLAATSSSSALSSMRTSQEESTLSPHPPVEEANNAVNKPRLSSSAPFSKSIARLSQYSHYSHHSSQQSYQSHQSQHSHLSGRSRDSRLSFEIREGSESHPKHPQQQGHSATGSNFLSASPPSLFSSQHADMNPPQQQQQKPHHVHYQMPQHAEVSVEEPGRYAERLVEFIRGVIV
ncbi:Phosphatidylinositol 4-phosphate 5-kinase 9 [Dissophora ornata]|nr:Phosphatidylinositol 4-phosphate 5-kinase 9 [Dissophora ornata]